MAPNTAVPVRLVALAACVGILALPAHALAQDKAKKDYVVMPGQAVPKTGAEYYSANPAKKLLMPIRVLGEVFQPGIHYVPIDSTLFDVVSYAGGPTSKASIDDVSLYRGGIVQHLELYSEAANRMQIAQGDSVVVDDSIKADMPLIFSGITAVVSILSLYLLSRDKL